LFIIWIAEEYNISEDKTISFSLTQNYTIKEIKEAYRKYKKGGSK